MFTDMLDSLMSERGINKRTLSRESGIPYTTIDGWYKKGNDDIRLSTLRKLSSYFDVSLDYLMEAQKESQTMAQELYQDQRELLKNYGQLDDEGKLLVRRLVAYTARTSIFNAVTKACHSTESASSALKQNIVISGGYYPNFGLASAGQGALAQDEPLDWSYDIDPPKGATCTITIKGDSMEPKLHDGQSVWVDTKKMVEPGQIGVFVINGNAYCKKYVLDKDGPKLASINPAYGPIELHEDDEIRLFGKVVF